MVRLKSQGFYSDNLNFKYEVNVNADGEFTTTLPKDIVDMFKKLNIEMDRNMQNRDGFFQAKSLEELSEKIHKVAINYSKKELIEEKVVLKYSVETLCNYCKGNNGIYPDGSWQTKAEGENDYNWVDGNGSLGSYGNGSFGFKIFVKAKLLKIWKFPNGEIKKEYSNVSSDMTDDDEVLDWLCSIRNMGEQNINSIKEVDYSLELGNFFKNMLMYVFNLNENMANLFGKDFDLEGIDIKSLLKLGFSDQHALTHDVNVLEGEA